MGDGFAAPLGIKSNHLKGLQRVSAHARRCFDAKIEGLQTHAQLGLFRHRAPAGLEDRGGDEGA